MTIIINSRYEWKGFNNGNQLLQWSRRCNEETNARDGLLFILNWFRRLPIMTVKNILTLRVDA